MNIAWLETRRGNNKGHRKASPNTEVSAGLRYASAMCKLLKADLITDASMIKYYEKTNYDIIIVGYSTVYQEFKLEADFIKNQKKASIIHITTEYGNSCPASIFYAKKPFLQISNVSHIPKNQTGGAWKYRNSYYHCNLNLLFFNPTKKTVKKRDINSIYYGRYREDRANYLKILNNTPVVVSTSIKNKPKWVLSGVNDVKYIKKLDWTPFRETLRLYMYSIYFEDTYTHSNYNCPANRYYEALSVDTLPLIHISCANTFKEAGIIWNDNVVFETAGELRKLVSSRTLYDSCVKWMQDEKSRIEQEKMLFEKDIKDVIFNYMEQSR